MAAAAAGATAAAAALNKAFAAEDPLAEPSSQAMLPVTAVDTLASGELCVWQRVLFAERLHELLAEEQVAGTAAAGAAADQTPSLLLTVPSKPYAGEVEVSPSGLAASHAEGQSEPVEMLPSRSMSAYHSQARISGASAHHDDRTLPPAQQQSAGQHDSQQEQLHPVQLELLEECAESLLLQENQTPRSHAAWLRQLHQEELEAAAARAAAAVAATEGHSRSSMHSWGVRAASSNPGLKPSPPGSYSAEASARSSTAGGPVLAAGVAAEVTAVAVGSSSLIAAARPGYSLSRQGSLPAAGPVAASRRSSSSVPGSGSLPGAKRQPRLTSLGGGYGSRSSSMVDPRGGARGYGSSSGGAAAAAKAGRTGITDKLLVQLGHAAVVVLSQQQDSAGIPGSGHAAGLREGAAGSTGGGDRELSTAEHSLGSLPAMEPSSGAAGAFPAASASTAGGPVSWPLNSWLSSTTSADSTASLGITRASVAGAQAARCRVSSCSSGAAHLPTSRSSTCSIGPHGRALKDGEVLTATQKAGLLRQVSAALATGVTMDELLLCCENSSGYTATAADRLSQLQQQQQPGPRVSMLGTALQGSQQQQRRYSMQSAVHCGDKRHAALKPGRHTWAGPSLCTLQETLSTPMQQDSMQAGAMQAPQQEGEAQLLDIMLATHASLQEQQEPAAAYSADTTTPHAHADGIYSSTAGAVSEAQAAPYCAALVPEGSQDAAPAQGSTGEEELIPPRADSPELSPGRLALRLSHQLSVNSRPSSPGIGSCRLSHTSSFDGYPFLAAQFSTGQLSCKHSQAGLLFPLSEQQPTQGPAPAVIHNFPLPGNTAGGISAGEDSSAEAPHGADSNSRRASNASSCNSSLLGGSRSMSPQAAAQPPSLSIIGKVRPSTSGTGVVAAVGPCGLRPASSGPLMLLEQQPMLLTTSLGPGQWELDLNLGQELAGHVGSGAAGQGSQPPSKEDSRGDEGAGVVLCTSFSSISASSSVMDFQPSSDTAAGADADVAAVEAAAQGPDTSTAATSASAAEGTLGLISSPVCDTGHPGPAVAPPSRGLIHSQGSKGSTWGGGTQDGSASSPRDPSHAAARRAGNAGNKGYSSCAGTSDSVVTHRVLTYENVTTVVWRERQHAQAAGMTVANAEYAASVAPLPAAPTGAAVVAAAAAAAGDDGGDAERMAVADAVESAGITAPEGEQVDPVAAVISLDSIPEDGEDSTCAGCIDEAAAQVRQITVESTQAATDASTGSSSSSSQQDAGDAAAAAAVAAAAPAAAAAAVVVDGTAADAPAGDASTSPAAELVKIDSSSDGAAEEPELAASCEAHSLSSEPNTTVLLPSTAAAVETASEAGVSSSAPAASPKSSRSSQRPASLLGGQDITKHCVSSITASSQELPAADADCTAAAAAASSSSSKSVPSSPSPSKKTAASIVTTAAPSASSPDSQEAVPQATRRYRKSCSTGSSGGGCGSNAGRSSGSKLLLAAAASRPGSPLKKLLVAAASAATGTGQSAPPGSSTSASKGGSSASRSSSRGHSITGSPVSSPMAGAAAAGAAATPSLASPSGVGTSSAHRTLTLQTSAAAAAAAEVDAASPAAALLSPSAATVGPMAPSSPGTAAGRVASKLRSSRSVGTFRSSSGLTVEVPSSPGKASMAKGSPVAAAVSAVGVVRSPGGHRTAPGGLSTGLSPQSSSARLGGLSAGPSSSSLHAQRSFSAFGRTLAPKSPTKESQTQQQQPPQSPKSPTKAPQQAQSPKAPKRQLSAKQQQLKADARKGRNSEGLTRETSAASSGDGSSASSRCLSLSSSMKVGLQQAAAAVVQETEGAAQGLPALIVPAAAAGTAFSSGSSGSSTPHSRQLQLQRLREVRQQQRKRSSAGGSVSVTPAASASAGGLLDGLLSQVETSSSSALAPNQNSDLLPAQEDSAAVAADAPGSSQVTPAAAAAAMGAVSKGGMGFVQQEAFSEGPLCWPLDLQASGVQSQSEAAEGAAEVLASCSSQICEALADGLPEALPVVLQSHPMASSADADGSVDGLAEVLEGSCIDGPLCWPLVLQLSERQTHSAADEAAVGQVAEAALALEGAANGGAAAEGPVLDSLMLAAASSPEPHSLSWPLELQSSEQQTHNSWGDSSTSLGGCSKAAGTAAADAASTPMPAQPSWDHSGASLGCSTAGGAGEMHLGVQPSWAQDSMGGEASSCSIQWAAITMFVAPDRLPSLPAEHSGDIQAAAAAATEEALAAAAAAASVTAALAAPVDDSEKSEASRPPSESCSQQLLQREGSSCATPELGVASTADADVGVHTQFAVCTAWESSWASDAAVQGVVEPLQEHSEAAATAAYHDSSNNSSSSCSAPAPASQVPCSDQAASEGCCLSRDAADITSAADSTSAAAEQSAPVLVEAAPAVDLLHTTAAEDPTVEEAVEEAAAGDIPGAGTAAAAAAAATEPAEQAAPAAAETADAVPDQVQLEAQLVAAGAHAEETPADTAGTSAAAAVAEVAAVAAAAAAKPAEAAAAAALLGEVSGAEPFNAATNSSGALTSASSSRRVSACGGNVAAADASRISVSSSSGRGRVSAGGAETAAGAAPAAAASVATAGPATYTGDADGDQDDAAAAVTVAEVAADAAASTLHAAVAEVPAGDADAYDCSEELPAAAPALANDALCDDDAVTYSNSIDASHEAATTAALAGILASLVPATTEPAAGAAAASTTALCEAAAAADAEDQHGALNNTAAAASSEAASYGAAAHDEAVSERTAADDTVDALLLQASPQLSGAAEPHVEASDAVDIVATAAAVAAAAAVSAPAPAVSADAPSAPADSWAAVAGATVLADSVAAAACAAAAAAALFVDAQEPQGPAVNEAAASDAAVAAGPALAVHGVNSPAAQESAVSTLADMAAETALAVAAVGCGEATDRHGAVCQQAAASSAGSSGPLFGSSPSASLVSFHLPEQYAVAGCGEAVESPTAVPAGSSRPVFGSSAGLGLVSFHLPELQAEASAARGGGATETPMCEQAAVSAGGSDHVFGHGPSAGLVSFHLPELQAEASAALSDRSSVWAAVPARGLLGSDASGYEAGAGGDPFQQGAAAGLAGGLPQNELLQVRAGLLCILSPSISHRSSLLPLSVWCH